MSDLLHASPLVRAVGVALVEFVWQGALIALVAGAALRALGAADPVARYLVACLSLGAMALVPVATAVVAYRVDPGALSAVARSAALPYSAAAAAAMPASALTSVLAREEWMPVIVGLWCAGVTLSSLHLAASWLLIGVVRRDAVRLSRRWQHHLATLAGRLGIGRRVRIAASRDVVVPTVMGWMRPLILLPTSTLSGLSPNELEAILVHELAHVRRHDYVINVVQGAIETLLFYHPAVWWMSRRIRAERELCCDDLVVEICGDRLTYARALASLETHRLQTPALAVAANGGELMNRITRLLGVVPQERSTTSIGGVVAVLVAVPFVLVGQAASSARTAIAPDEHQRPAVTGTPAMEVAGARPLDIGSAAEAALKVELRYASLVDRYQAIVRAERNQNAQAAAGVSPAAAAPQAADARAAERRLEVEQDANALISQLQQLLQSGRLAEGQVVLDRLAATLDWMSRQTTPRPAMPPPPPSPPASAEREAAIYAQGLVASAGVDALTPAAPVRVGGNVPAPAKIRNVDPVYPAEAKAAGIQGIVILECVIDPGGNVVDIKLLRGNPMLNQAALDATSQWKYTAPTLNNSPVSVIMTVTVNFTLN